MAGMRESKVGASALDIGNVIAALTEEQVECMTGLTKGRLRYWARTDFFRPSYVEDDPRHAFSRFYSFKDVVALRTLELLRVQNGVALQHLRKVAEKLSHLKDDLWTKTTLFVVKKKVVFVNPETGKPEEIVSGQYLLGIPLKRIIDDTSADIVSLSKRRAETIGRITRNKNVIRNAWVVDGTRIPVGAVRRFHEDGYSFDEIIEEYPDLTIQDIEAALAHTETTAA